MITKNVSNKGQVQIVSLDQLVPEDHILRKIDRSVDFSFIYDLVEDKYSSDNGRPSIDPVMLIKIPIIQYMFGIKSMRQTIKDIEQIFANILMQCMKYDLVDPSTIFVDATHVKAAANRKKSKKILVARKTARFYDEQLKNEINADREAHGKKPLKDKEDDNSDDDPAKRGLKGKEGKHHRS